jgi:hypothetical protein
LETPIPADKTLHFSHIGERAMDESPLAELKVL